MLIGKFTLKIEKWTTLVLCRCLTKMVLNDFRYSEIITVAISLCSLPFSLQHISIFGFTFIIMTAQCYCTFSSVAYFFLLIYHKYLHFNSYITCNVVLLQCHPSLRDCKLQMGRKCPLFVLSSILGPASVLIDWWLLFCLY